MFSATTVTGMQELYQVLDLQRKNQKQLIAEEEKTSQGFITMIYTPELLQAMHDLAPSIIIKNENEVVAFALVFLKEGKHLYADLEAMYTHLDNLSWKGKPINEYKTYVMGQVCVAREYRGQGLFELLYEKHRELYQHEFDMVITEISTSNFRSLRAHAKVGFEVIATYRDHLDEWAVVVWDWSTSAPVR
jgi:GNAT superfamily N-acetyltransferase